MYLILVFIFGLIIGSFLNVCIYRIPREESIIYPPSNCNTCGYNLRAVDLIPVISYLFLKGRCRTCREKISLKYPVIEIINAIFYCGLFLKFGFTIYFYKYCILTSLLIVISVIDYDNKEVYNSTTLFGLAMGGVFVFIEYYLNGVFNWSYILGAIFGFCAIYLIVILTNGMGVGDADIVAVCGLFLGWKGVFITLFFAIVIGGIIALYLLISKKGDRKQEIAFGPFVALGCSLTILYGYQIISMYLMIFKI